MKIVGNLSEIEAININNIAKTYKDSVGEPPRVVKAIVLTNVTNTNGEEQQASYIQFEDGSAMGGTSGTIYNSLAPAMELLEAGKRFKASVITEKSKGDRDFCKVVWSV